MKEDKTRCQNDDIKSPLGEQESEIWSITVACTVDGLWPTLVFLPVKGTE